MQLLGWTLGAAGLVIGAALCVEVLSRINEHALEHRGDAHSRAAVFKAVERCAHWIKATIGPPWFMLYTINTLVLVGVLLWRALIWWFGGTMTTGMSAMFWVTLIGSIRTMGLLHDRDPSWR